MLELTLFNDPGHAWLQVPRKIMRNVYVSQPFDISSYSYWDGGFFYLEEDVDMPAFLESAKAVGLSHYIIQSEHGEFVRSLQRTKKTN